MGESMEKQLREPFSFPEMNTAANGSSLGDLDDGIPRLSGLPPRRARTKSKQLAKVSEVSWVLGKAGTRGVGIAVEVLGTLVNSMTNLNLSNGFGSKGHKISILAFEIANTIIKGANIMQSLSKKNVINLKQVVLPSEGVQHLVSKDMDELLRIASADKREELKLFSGEVVRFGNLCIDPQWHNLDRYFEKLGAELTPHRQLKEEADTVIEQLTALAQYTAELYHECHALDSFDKDYIRILQEKYKSNAAKKGLLLSCGRPPSEYGGDLLTNGQSPTSTISRPHTGDSLAILREEWKNLKKNVRSLKIKSLWTMNIEEVTAKLVNVVHFLHQEINDAFGSTDGDKPVKGSSNNHKKLGSAGLALHYANIIAQIDTLERSVKEEMSHTSPSTVEQVSRPSCALPNTRDALYQGLPPSIKSALRSKLQVLQVKEELTVTQIKAEMEKTLRWLVPLATNTIKAHHGFGWVGEWANIRFGGNWKPVEQTDFFRIETLHHADKEKTEACILELVVWLHHLVSQSMTGTRSPIKSAICSPTQNVIVLPMHKPNASSPILTAEDQAMLRDVNKRRLIPGISKSQQFGTVKTRLNKHNWLSKSNSHTPKTGNGIFPVRRLSTVPVIDFDTDRIKTLDVIDGLDTLGSL